MRNDKASHSSSTKKGDRTTLNYLPRLVEDCRVRLATTHFYNIHQNFPGPKLSKTSHTSKTEKGINSFLIRAKSVKILSFSSAMINISL